MSDLNYHIEIELRYEKKGVLSTCYSNEHFNIRLNDMEAVKNYYREDLIKAVKKAVNLMSNDNFYKVELSLNTLKEYSIHNSICLVYRGATDKFNDTYTIYRYCNFDLSKYYASADCHDNGTATVSKKALLSELTGYIDKLIKKYEVENDI